MTSPDVQYVPIRNRAGEYIPNCAYCGEGARVDQSGSMQGEKPTDDGSQETVRCHEFAICSYEESVLPAKAQKWREEVIRWAGMPGHPTWKQRQSVLMKRYKSDDLAPRGHHLYPELLERQRARCELNAGLAVTVAGLRVTYLTRRDQFDMDPASVIAALTPIPGPAFDQDAFFSHFFGEVEPAWLFGSGDWLDALRNTPEVERRGKNCFDRLSERSPRRHVLK